MLKGHKKGCQDTAISPGTKAKGTVAHHPNAQMSANANHAL